MDRIVVCAWCPEDRQQEPGAVRLRSGTCPSCVDDFAGCRVAGVELAMRQTASGASLPQTTVRLGARSLVFLGRPGPLLQVGYDAIVSRHAPVDPRD